MLNQIKFEDQELNQLKDLQSEYQKLVYSWGQLQMEKRIIENKEKEITSIYDSLNLKERELLDNLNKKYGDGSLNLENGTFTPNS